jgi:large subunit ribosomal protein L23
MLITPRVSEKSYKLNADNVYVFDVPKGANKAEIIAEIEKQYGVKVKDARMLVAKGKAKAVNRGKRARPTTTHRKDTKKAYVRVLEGKIEIAAFQEIDNQAKASDNDVTASEAKQSSKKLDRRADKSARDDAGDTEAKQAGLVTRRRTGRRGDR